MKCAVGFSDAQIFGFDAGDLAYRVGRGKLGRPSLTQFAHPDKIIRAGRRGYFDLAACVATHRTLSRKASGIKNGSRFAEGFGWLEAST